MTVEKAKINVVRCTFLRRFQGWLWTFATAGLGINQTPGSSQHDCCQCLISDPRAALDYLSKNRQGKLLLFRKTSKRAC